MYHLFPRLGILLIVFFIGTVSSFGQSTTAQIDSLNSAAFQLRVENQELSICMSRQAISLNQINYEKGYYTSCLNLGIVFTNLSQYDSAFHYLRNSLQYFRDDLEVGLTKYYLGINYSSLRDFDRAKMLFAQARMHFENCQNIDYQAYVDNSMGIIYGRLGEYDEALKWFLSAYQIKMENGLLYDEELTNISIVYRLMGKPHESLDFLYKSLELIEKEHDSLGLAQIYVSIGKVFFTLEEYDSAVNYYNAAKSIAEINHFPRQLASAMTNKSALLVKLGKYDEAISSLNSAINYVAEKDDVVESIYATLADVYFKLENLDSALKYSEKAYHIALKSQNLGMSSSMAKTMADIYEAKSKLGKAIHYLKMYSLFADSLNAKSKEDEISDLRVSIETLEKDHEIAILNAEKEVESLERDRIIFALIATLASAAFIILLLIHRSMEAKRARQLKESSLKAQIELGQEDLYRQTLHMMHVNNTLNGIEEQLKSKEDNQKILSAIKYNKSLDKDWENFNNYFGNVHSGFNEKLSEIAADLTTHEKRVCALLKINLSNREIATILNIESKSVAMIKYRIKKKLELSEEQDLVVYLQSLIPQNG